MKKLKELISKNKKTTTILFAAIGICTIFLSYIPNSLKDRNVTKQDTYLQLLEEKTKTTIEKIAGNDTTEVMITLKNNYVLSETDSVSAFSERDSHSTNGYICVPSPEITGVMIICTSLSNREDFSTIKKAVATCLGIKQSQIYIIGGKTQHEKDT